MRFKHVKEPIGPFDHIIQVHVTDDTIGPSLDSLISLLFLA